MFYCDTCANGSTVTGAKRNWPITAFKSHGGCEICKEVGLCSEMPSKNLPIPGMTMEETREHERQLDIRLKEMQAAAKRRNK